ncbi:hypothetical protein [Hymenobacter psoromatis]|uniref:hypothetical protein n=1 Tax=Hymenobacter psoromatis TaxID=1484116 RepID=UPI001CC0230F|nr:hypothetical protein [Hymenobacter psoromatis]
MNRLISSSILVAFSAAALVVNAQAPATSNSLNDCFGEKRAIKIDRNMPYILVKLGDAEGEFVVDFASNVTSIDPAGFKQGIKPVPNNGNSISYEFSYYFDRFDFFGRTGAVKLIARKTTVNNTDLQQAGILGTDFFMEFVFTLDYVNKFLYKSKKEAFCTDEALMKAGFKPVSTDGYYADNFSRLKDPATTINVPTVPVKIGGITAIAQLDPAYDDSVYPHTVNVNLAFFNAIKSAGIPLIEVKNINLTMCNGSSDKGTAYRLGPGYDFEVIGVDGKPASVEHNAFIFVKDGTTSQGCSGIGTWPNAAAQIGASFLIGYKQIVFDPFSSRVWFAGSTEPKQQNQQYPISEQQLKNQQLDTPRQQKKMQRNL